MFVDGNSILYIVGQHLFKAISHNREYKYVGERERNGVRGEGEKERGERERGEEEMGEGEGRDSGEREGREGRG